MKCARAQERERERMKENLFIIFLLHFFVFFLYNHFTLYITKYIYFLLLLSKITTRLEKEENYTEREREEKEEGSIYYLFFF
jgi:hypothetical protein